MPQTTSVPGHIAEYTTDFEHTAWRNPDETDLENYSLSISYHSSSRKGVRFPGRRPINSHIQP